MWSVCGVKKARWQQTRQKLMSREEDEFTGEAKNRADFPRATEMLILSSQLEEASLAWNVTVET